MRDVLDGKFTGEMTAEETISQFEFRAGIHLTYINLLEEQPDSGWEAYGSKAWHEWAINGYEEGIRHIREKIPTTIIEYRCGFTEFIKNLFGG